MTCLSRAEGAGPGGKRGASASTAQAGCLTGQTTGRSQGDFFRGGLLWGTRGERHDDGRHHEVRPSFGGGQIQQWPPPGRARHIPAPALAALPTRFAHSPRGPREWASRDRVGPGVSSIVGLCVVDISKCDVKQRSKAIGRRRMHSRHCRLLSEKCKWSTTDMRERQVLRCFRWRAKAGPRKRARDHTQSNRSLDWTVFASSIQADGNSDDPTAMILSPPAEDEPRDSVHVRVQRVQTGGNVGTSRDGRGEILPEED